MTAALSHFPRASTRFIGRSHETASLAQQLTTTRLVTIVGAGGCGKTRLALEGAARAAEQFADGAYFIDLAPLNDAALLAVTVAAALGVRDQPEQSILDTLLHALAEKNLLLVLDNCEHLRAACAELAAALCDVCPRVAVLATSRAALGMPQEKIFALAPMRADEARALFADRARHASSVFERSAANENAIAEICARLDHLPLALELAAARVKMLAPAQIAARLDDRFRLLKNQAAAPARQATLRALLDWSDELLRDDERALFHTLGVFAGSFDLEAVEGLMADGGPQTTAALDVLTELAAKSLLVVEADAADTRYRLLETMREYAREQLRARDEWQNARANHFAYFLQLAERADPELKTSAQNDWFARFDREQDNLRAAMQFALEIPDGENGLRVANVLWRYWNNRGRFYEGQRWFESFLACATAEIAPHVLARAEFSLAAILYRLGNLERATAHCETSLEMRRALQDTDGVSSAISLLAMIATDRGDFVRARALHAESLETSRALGDDYGAAISLQHLGLVALRQADFASARAYFQEGLQVHRALNDHASAAASLGNLGEIATYRGEYEHACALFQEGIALARAHHNDHTLAFLLNDLGVAQRALGLRDDALASQRASLDLRRASGNRVGIATTLINLGDLERDAGAVGSAVALYEQGLAEFRALDSDWGIPIALNALGVGLRFLGDLTRAATCHYEAMTRNERNQNRLGIAESLEGLAGVAQAWNEPARALEWLGAARARREEMGTPMYPFDQPLRDEIETRAKHALGEGAAVAALARGRALPPEAMRAEIDAWHARRMQPTVAVSPALELYAFGETRVFRRGKVLDSKAWRYAQAREIVFYLLTRGAVSKEKLALDLWQDASPEQIRRALHRVLHHARAALGSGDWIVFEQEQYSFNRALPYAYDVERFAHALAEARAHKRGEAHLAALQRAVNVYDGDFLADAESEWAAVERAARREQFFDAAAKLGAGYLDTARYADAGAVYEKIIAHDNLNEDAHRALMRCFAKLGDAPRALRQYETLRQILRDEFRTEPSRETRVLYEQLKRGDAS
jgi:predicted ATPase/two-component SAPR family response regulator